MADVIIGEARWERMIRAVERVRERLVRAAAALEVHGIPYAVTGGNAVAAWVARVDEAAVRNTQDVDIILRRADLDAAEDALKEAGFTHCSTAGVESFLDGPDGKSRDAVHVIFAGGKVRPDQLSPTPDPSESEMTPWFRLLRLDSLVRMELSSFCLNDRVDLGDLIDVGLVDESWLGSLPEELAPRLRRLLDDREE